MPRRIRPRRSSTARGKRAGAAPRRHAWSEETIKRALRALAARGESVNPTRAGLPLYYACRAYYGSFGAACRAAGVDRGRERKWSDDEIVATLRRLARSGSKVITGSRVPYPLRKACRRYYGSLAAACAAAGVASDTRIQQLAAGRRRPAKKRARR